MTFPFPFISPGGTLTPPAVPQFGSYTLINKATLTDTSAGAMIEWDNTVEDWLNIHDEVTDNTKFIIPVGLNGRYARMSCGIYGIAHEIEMLKNGATYVGAGINWMNETLNEESITLQGAAVLLTTGDEFEIRGLSAGNLDASNPETWAQMELLPAGFDGALVYKSGTQGNNNANSAVTFDTEVYDTLGFHDNATNNHLFTIPSGVDLVRLTGCLKLASGTTTRLVLQIWKNGAVFRGCPLMGRDAAAVNSAEAFSVTTGPVPCVAGDTFEFRVYNNGNCTVTVENTWFEIEVLDPALKYALVWKDDLQGQTAGNPAILDFTQEVADVGGWHTGSSSQLVVPNGVARVRINFSCRTWTSESGDLRAYVTKNGADFDGMPSMDTDYTTSVMAVSGASAIVEVVPGDYFELVAVCGSSTTYHDDAEMWFSIEEAPDYN